MRSKAKYQPYIRLANGRERASSHIVALRLAYRRLLNKPFYVMVQRGFPNLVVAVDTSRSAVKNTILYVYSKRATFKEWSRDIRKKAHKKGRCKK